MKKELKYYMALFFSKILTAKNFIVFKGIIMRREIADLKNPKTLNDKIRWMMLNYHDEKLNEVIDKVKVREYVKSTIGGEYLIKVLGIYNNAAGINFEKLPNRFIIKTNHGSGWNIICYDKQQLDIKRTVKQLNKWMNRNYYDHTKEWGYRDIVPKIIIEELLDDGFNKLPIDFKVYCFHGEPKFTEVGVGRDVDIKWGIYDNFWNPMRYSGNFKNIDYAIVKPDEFDEMLVLASKLSKNFPFSRIDFYIVDHQIYFGEITIYSDAGCSACDSKEYNELFSSYLDISFIG